MDVKVWVAQYTLMIIKKIKTNKQKKVNKKKG